MKITSVKYKSDSIRLIIEDGRYFILPVTSEYMKLSADTEITDEYIIKISASSEFFLCRRQLFKYLSSSDKSAFECRMYLKKKKYDSEIINQIINEFRQKNYINDNEFTKKYLNFLKRTKTVGKNYILNKLYLKEIDKSIIESVIDEIKEFDEEYDDIIKLAEKKYKSVCNKKNSYGKLVYFLQSRGFTNQTIFKVIDMLKNKGFIFTKNENNQDK